MFDSVGVIAGFDERFRQQCHASHGCFQFVRHVGHEVPARGFQPHVFRLVGAVDDHEVPVGKGEWFDHGFHSADAASRALLPRRKVQGLGFLVGEYVVRLAPHVGAHGVVRYDPQRVGLSVGKHHIPLMRHHRHPRWRALHRKVQQLAYRRPGGGGGAAVAGDQQRHDRDHHPNHDANEAPDNHRRQGKPVTFRPARRRQRHPRRRPPGQGTCHRGW